MELKILKREGDGKIQVTLTEFAGVYNVGTIKLPNETLEYLRFKDLEKAENAYYENCDLNGLGGSK